MFIFTFGTTRWLQLIVDLIGDNQGSTIFILGSFKHPIWIQQKYNLYNHATATHSTNQSINQYIIQKIQYKLNYIVS